MTTTHRNRGLGKRGHLFPRTSRKPISIGEYLELQARSAIVDHDRLTPDWLAWYERMRSKYMK